MNYFVFACAGKIESLRIWWTKWKANWNLLTRRTMYEQVYVKLNQINFRIHLHIIDSWLRRLTKLRKLMVDAPRKNLTSNSMISLLNAARVVPLKLVYARPFLGTTTLSPVATSPWPIVPDVNYGGQSPQKFRAGFLVVVALSRTCACSWTRKHLQGKDYAREFGRPPLSTPNRYETRCQNPFWNT